MADVPWTKPIALELRSIFFDSVVDTKKNYVYNLYTVEENASKN